MDVRMQAVEQRLQTVDELQDTVLGFRDELQNVGRALRQEMQRVAQEVKDRGHGVPKRNGDHRTNNNNPDDHRRPRIPSMDFPKYELSHLRQTGTLKEFNVKFDTLAARLNLPEAYLVDVYVGALREEIADSVRFFNPRTLVEAQRMARVQEISLLWRSKKKMVLPIKNGLQEKFPEPPEPIAKQEGDFKTDQDSFINIESSLTFNFKTQGLLADGGYASSLSSNTEVESMEITSGVNRSGRFDSAGGVSKPISLVSGSSSLAAHVERNSDLRVETVAIPHDGILLIPDDGKYRNGSSCRYDASSMRLSMAEKIWRSIVGLGLLQNDPVVSVAFQANKKASAAVRILIGVEREVARHYIYKWIRYRDEAAGFDVLGFRVERRRIEWEADELLKLYHLKKPRTILYWQDTVSNNSPLDQRFVQNEDNAQTSENAEHLAESARELTWLQGYQFEKSDLQLSGTSFKLQQCFQGFIGAYRIQWASGFGWNSKEGSPISLQFCSTIPVGAINYGSFQKWVSFLNFSPARILVLEWFKGELITMLFGRDCSLSRKKRRK